MARKQDRQILGHQKARSKDDGKETVSSGWEAEYLEAGVTVKAGRTVQDCVLDPQATSRFSGFLERLEELRKVIILTVSVYYSRRVQSKISKGPQWTGQSPGKMQYKLLCTLVLDVSSQRSPQEGTQSPSKCVTPDVKCYPSGKLTQALMSVVYAGSESQRPGAFLTCLSCPVCSSCRGQTATKSTRHPP